MLPFKILCPTDFSQPSFAAVDQAIELASHFRAELCLLHVVPFSPVSSPDPMAMMSIPPDAERMRDAAALLQEVVKERVPQGINVKCEVKMGYPDKEIACVVKDGGFDWLVIATHGLSGWRHMVFGSVAEAIVRDVRCPVLTVHGLPDVKPQNGYLLPVPQEVELV